MKLLIGIIVAAYATEYRFKGLKRIVKAYVNHGAIAHNLTVDNGQLILDKPNSLVTDCVFKNMPVAMQIRTPTIHLGN